MAKVAHSYAVSDNGIIVVMDDGSSFHIYGLGQNSTSISYAPDDKHYPESLTIDGRKPDGPFTPNGS